MLASIQGPVKPGQVPPGDRPATGPARAIWDSFQSVMPREAAPARPVLPEPDVSQAALEAQQEGPVATGGKAGNAMAFRAMESESPSLFPSPDHNYQYNPYDQGAQHQPHPYTSGTEASVNAPGPGDKIFWDRMSREMKKSASANMPSKTRRG